MSQHTTLKLKDIILTNTIIILIFLGLMFPMNAMAIDVYGADVVDYGIYETDFVRFEKAPDTVIGRIEMVSEEMQLLRNTELIPGKRGTEFGIRYILNGDQDGKEVDISVKVLHSMSVNKKEVSYVVPSGVEVSRKKILRLLNKKTSVGGLHQNQRKTQIPHC